MSFDPLVSNAGRLRILTSLAVEERQEFVHLRRSTQLTDGNLAAHAKRLSSAGLIHIDKEFREGKPVTSYVLTAAGRHALEAHARRLFAAITQRRLAPAGDAPRNPAVEDSATARRAVRRNSRHDDEISDRPPPDPAVLSAGDAADDWVD